jgi:2',3'-cyclic-nucleotide 2'-phosphodiesterase (5'-nucleotidase family)
LLFCLWLTCALAAQAQQPRPQHRQQEPGAPSKTRASRTAIDASIPDDAAMDALIAPYRARLRELEVVIGRLEGTLVKGRIVGGTMGNFVTDAVRVQAGARLGRPVRVAILNRDGMRRNMVAPGELRARDIFEMLPFENELMLVEMKGAQLRRFIEVLIANKDLAQSGAQVRYRLNERGAYEAVSLKLIGPNGTLEEIDPEQSYSVVTVDFVLTRGGPYEFLQAIPARAIGLKIRDAVSAEVKAKAARGESVRAGDDRRIEGPGMEEVDIT